MLGAVVKNLSYNHNHHMCECVRKYVHRCHFECCFFRIIVRVCAAAVRVYLCVSVLLNNPSFYTGL